MNPSNPDLVSEVRVTPIAARDTLLAFASVLYRNELRLSDIALHCTRDGDDFTIAFPQKRMFNGAIVHAVYPIQKEVTEAIRAAIITKFLALTKQNGVRNDDET